MTPCDVSIIVTSYNYERYIERCVRSCLSQEGNPPRFEVVVVDDCSTDHSVDAVRKFEEYYQNVRLLRTAENVGVAEASNVGIRAALGRYVVRVDADDYIGEYMIKFLSHYLDQNPDAFCVASDYYLVDDGQQTRERCSAAEAPIACGVMYRKDALVAAGLYNGAIRHREEEELRTRLQYETHYLRIPFYRYRRHATNKTKSRAYQEAPVPVAGRRVI